MVDTLDQDLDLDGDAAKDDEEKKDKPTITSVGLKESIKNVAAKSDERKDSKADDDDEVQLEEPAEDVKDDDEKKTNLANDSNATKLAGSQLSQPEEEQPGPKRDYTLIDTLCQFLYEDEDPLPILTGYFLKVMEQLLDKQKQATLEYLLLHQQGKIFNGLLRHLDHHSLATLLIKLIEQQIKPEKKDKWDTSDNYDLDLDSEHPEQELTAD